MSKLVLINVSCGVGSTGKICTSIAEAYEAKGWEVRIAYGRVFEVPIQYQNIAIKIGNKANIISHAIYTRIFDKHGLASKSATKKFLVWLDKFNPDILWLHNIHGYYINYEMLFSWIKKKNIEVKWTLHDCWAFTGHCSHFTFAECLKWENGCSKCPQKNKYPGSYLFDNSRNNYKRKQRAFTDVPKMTIVVPSEWLKEHVQKSFLGNYEIKVHYNEIDKTIFRHRKSDFRIKNNLNDKIVILGVAYIWSATKGLDDFVKLSGMLDNRYTIVLIGLKKRQIKKLPSNIIGMAKTSNQIELAEIYSAADYFVNPSLQETFGMTTAEAICCGTKAIVYSGTACEEIANKYGGKVIQKGNVKAIYDYIQGDSVKRIKK